MDRSHRYDDIIGLPRPGSDRHLPMPLADRAAQFAPFAALVGDEDAVREEERRTEEFVFLEEDEKAVLDAALRDIRSRLRERPEVTVTYFEKDMFKSGGTYLRKTGVVQKLCDVEKAILFEDGTLVELRLLRSVSLL